MINAKEIHGFSMFKVQKASVARKQYSVLEWKFKKKYTHTHARIIDIRTNILQRVET